ncbi:BLUF domain-containing protein [Terasakiella sp. SH-1]|uniref:BLUF domain-containing protein n=1 Tax=Terasakiella sp. SH-1 TaxID=2560057 RepID=UPI00142FFDE2|nr:BLUF domain-containing protein [Terasakiella sp. SH-1]
MRQLSQIIYASAASREFDTQELNAILNTARDRNKESGISGILVYRSGSFLQVLEGPKEEVGQLFDKITQDKRHSKLKLIYRGDIQEKEFQNWSMGFVDTELSPQKMEGYFDYDNELEDFFVDLTRARMVLKRFSSGAWRQVVKH